MISVGVSGALGRMGTYVCEAVRAEPDMRLTEVIDPKYRECRNESKSKGRERCFFSVEEIESPEMQVLIDFTNREAAFGNVIWALQNRIHCVVGTTGFSEEEIAEIGVRAKDTGANVIMASNFAFGAVLMMKFAEAAAGVYDRCEIIELHHAGKLDSPSGTALSTASRIDAKMKSRGVSSDEPAKDGSARGATKGNVRIHSVRLDGLVAHQEVIFGSRGETLTIRHDTTDRSCFMPGVLLAVRKVFELPGLTIGIEHLLGI